MKLTRGAMGSNQLILNKYLPIKCGWALGLCLLLLTGCATNYHSQKIEPTTIEQAEEEIPEEKLMDIGITVFSEGEISEEDIKKKNVNPDIRRSEIYFIPFHLKNTLQQSGQWGSIWVMPSDIEGVDLTIQGEVLESNGKRLVLQVVVTDAAGKIWLEKTYEEEARAESFQQNVLGEKDAFQDLYNTIANDIAALKNDMSSEDMQRIRTVAKLKFARDIAPDAFDSYLQENKEGEFEINRLPAESDTFMERTLLIREREYMFMDTLNAHYESFYTRMWPDYMSWRESDRLERIALAKMKRDAFIRKAGGILLIALAVAAEVAGGGGTGALESAMIMGGGKVFYDGVSISKQAKIHSEAIRELGDSFGSEMKPVVMEFEGKKYELTGNASEQFDKWRDLLRKIYYTETGFTQNAPDNAPTPDL